MSSTSPREPRPVARSLQLREARRRRADLDVHGYEVELDLTGSETFESRCAVRFSSTTCETFLDLLPVTLHRATLDGVDLEVSTLDTGRLPLSLSAGEHRLETVATMPFRNDGEGVHRAVDPADGEVYVYGMNFLDAARTVYGCFDQPDLKARWTFRITAPRTWLVRTNSEGEQIAPGRWEFAETEPLSTYFVSLVAGPFHVVHDHHDGIDLAVLARASLADRLDAQADDILTVTRQCFDEYHRLFGLRYAFGKYDQVFVPEFNAGAMENPGLVLFRDPLIFTGTPTRGDLIKRAMIISHEMAHQWFGNLVTLAWWDDLWLNESFAEYLGYRVAAAVTDYTDAWIEQANTRRVWGLTADSRPTTHPVAAAERADAASALQEFDGISYAKGSSLLRQLAARLGDEVFLTGVRRHFARHRFGNAAMQDLVDSWEEAGAEGLQPWVDAWLRTSGHDRLEVVPDGIRRSPASGRDHLLHLARWTGTAWTREPLRIEADLTRIDTTSPVLLDPWDEAWADLPISADLLAVLPDAIGALDPLGRAAIWNALRLGVFHGTLSPADALPPVLSGLTVEGQDPAITTVVSWLGSLLAVSRDPATTTALLHRALRERWVSAEPDSGLARAALTGAIGTSTDVAELSSWRGRPDIEDTSVDLNLRWQVVRRLAQLGSLDASALDAELEQDRTAESTVHHAWARACLATPEAKAWAWQRFTGEVEVPNYELEATGQGMWQTGQDDLLAPYADRYFAELPATAAVRRGWVLGTATAVFFPMSLLSPRTLDAAGAALEGELDPTIRHQLLDLADELSRRLRAASF